MSAIREFLSGQLSAGEWVLGQIRVTPGIVLRHVDDSAAARLAIFTRPTDARDLAKFDDAGNYRPLKTAPNLRHGWELRLGDLDGLRLALDFFYPAAIGTWLAEQRGDLTPIPLRDTLARQTGMYRVTRHIGDDKAAAVVQKICRGGCLRHRLWSITAENSEPPCAQPSPITRRDLPILCAEACNLFVAACRPVAKGNPRKSA
ncbi:MAG: DR2241 family protein [Terrimicrobiaceae bacterium]|nr:DR2241 family protein [Terrimicrobiaceae bacterium]